MHTRFLWKPAAFIFRWQESYVDQQAYKEVVEDGHPILIVTASDIAAILRRNSIDNTNINSWLTYIDKGYTASFEIKNLKVAEE